MGTLVEPYSGYDNEVVLFDKASISLKDAKKGVFSYGGDISHDQNPNECTLNWDPVKGYYYNFLQGGEVSVGKKWEDVLNVLYKSSERKFVHLSESDHQFHINDDIIGFLINPPSNGKYIAFTPNRYSDVIDGNGNVSPINDDLDDWLINFLSIWT